MALPSARSAGTEAPPAAEPLPHELGTVLLSMATCAVPISLVSRMSRHLSEALDGRPLADSELVVLAGALARASGPWLPSRHRFDHLCGQVTAVLDRAGCSPRDVQAVVTDLHDAFVARITH